MHPWPSKARHGEGLGWVWFADAANSWRMSSASASTCAVAHRTAKPKMVVVAMRCDVQRYDTSCHCASVLEWHSCADRRAYVSLLRGYSQSTGRRSPGRGGGPERLAVVFRATAADQLLRVLDLRSGTRLRDAVCDHLAAEAVASVARCMRHAVRPRAVMLAFRPPTRSDPPCACDARGMGAQACITYCVPY